MASGKDNTFAPHLVNPVDPLRIETNSAKSAPPPPKAALPKSLPTQKESK